MTPKDSKTHHKSSGSSVMTIPKLRKSFEHIEAFASNTKDPVQLKKEWKKVFGGKGITDEQATSYLAYLNEHKSQSGGSPGLYSSSTVPGQDVPGGYAPYGNFLTYQMKGFDIGVPQNSQTELCGKVDITPTLLPDMGSNLVTNMKGGYKKGKRMTKRNKTKSGTNKMREMRSRKYSERMRQKTRKLKGGTRFPIATNPTSVWQDAFTALRGQPLGASPSPTDPVPNKLFPVPSPYNIQVSEINRTMTNDIRSV
jgi:hypothetical protein